MTNLPITGAFRITAVYGQKGSHWANGHEGIDFVADDKRIFATCDGTVRTVAYDPGGWGHYISIGDAEGRRHIFCHLEAGSVRVKIGQTVTRETVIGTMGATGNVTGVHLHYQLQQGTVVIDPCGYLGVPNKVGSYHSKDYALEKANILDRFKDVNRIPKWARDERVAEKVVEAGIVKGDDDGKLRPADNIKRIESWAVISRALGLSYNGTEGLLNHFKDSARIPRWALDEWVVEKVVAAGIVKGDDNGNLRPADDITRVEAWAVVARALGLTYNGPADILIRFGDVDKIPKWARDERVVEKVVAAGIVKGDDNGNLRPADDITRIEFWAVVARGLGL